jgi:hypothetical protein
LSEKNSVVTRLEWSKVILIVTRFIVTKWHQFLVIPNHPWATQSCFDLGWTYYDMMLRQCLYPNKCLDIMTTLNDLCKFDDHCAFFHNCIFNNSSHFWKTSINIFIINSNDIPRHQ